jgi:tRNA A37 threonylcarbamoyladenosine dehydratase
MKTLVHEEVYRGSGLMGKLATQPITLCGAGAIGSNLADNLVRQGFGVLSVIDMDRVEDHNRNNQIWSSRDVGQFKAITLRNHIFNTMKVIVHAIPKKLIEGNVEKLINPKSIVVDGFDNPESRKLLRDHCRDTEIDCLHLGLAADFAEITWNEVYRIPVIDKGIDICEYPLARNIALMSVIVGTESLIRFIDKGVKESYIISLKDLKITNVGI